MGILRLIRINSISSTKSHSPLSPCFSLLFNLLHYTCRLFLFNVYACYVYENCVDEIYYCNVFNMYRNYLQRKNNFVRKCSIPPVFSLHF